MQWAAPFKVGLGFLLVQCPPAFEAVFRSSSCLKSRTWTKKELSCAVFIGSQLLRQCAGEVPTVGKWILLHWCTLLYYTLPPGCISQCCWKLTQVSHNFCRRLYPEGSTLTTFTPPESFSLAFTSIPPALFYSIPPDSISMLTPVFLSFLSQLGTPKAQLWKIAFATLQFLLFAPMQVLAKMIFKSEDMLGMTTILNHYGLRWQL